MKSFYVLVVSEFQRLMVFPSSCLITGGKLRLIIQGLDEPMLDGPESTKERRNLVVNYMMSHLNTHNFYIAKFIFCELLNLANIVTQVV